jgi:hypothetical protein
VFYSINSLIVSSSASGEPETEDELVLVNPRAFAELLRTPALRFVEFKDFYFTDALCRTTAAVFEEGSSAHINFIDQMHLLTEESYCLGTLWKQK